MGRKLTVTALILFVALILAALFLETSRGPTFRAADHATLEDCVRNIPREWRPGSLDYEGAETACYYVHRNR